jgi:hypothetical protein
MKRGWMIAAAALVAGACSADGNDRQQTTGEELPARTGPARPPEAHAEGMYVLTAINGGGLPGVVQESDGCRVEVVEGSLRLEAGRFAFQNRTREVCGPAPAPRPPGSAGAAPGEVMHAAGGVYTVQNGQVRLDTDVGGAFATALGTADSTTITLRELSTEAGTETVTWRFERRDAQSVPLPGSTGTDTETEAEMSRTPGVTGGS